MENERFNFLEHLLADNRLTTSQKERIFKLYKSEVKDRGPIKPNSNYINPLHLYRFLKDYNRDEILKTTCHEIDSNQLEIIKNFCKTEDYDFIKHRDVVQKRFLEFVSNKEYFVDKNIKNLMYVYITGKTYNNIKVGWTEDKIKINWNSQELEKWSLENRNKVPHPNDGLYRKQGSIQYEISPSIETKLLGFKKLTSFSDTILHFKHLFHLRFDNSLLKILKKINNDSEFWKDKVDFEFDEEFPENFEFFTNIEKLLQAYNILINLVIEVSKNTKEKPIVKLSLRLKNDNEMNFSIHHINSVFQKSIADVEEESNGQTFSDLIKNQINGMCDFYLSADFGNYKFASINIWNGKPKKATIIDAFKGVEYILKFKK